MLVKFFQDQNFLAKIHVERNLIVLNMNVNLNAMKGLVYLVKKKLKLIASVGETKSTYLAVLNNLDVTIYVENNWIAINIIVNANVKKDIVIHVQKILLG